MRPTSYKDPKMLCSKSFRIKRPIAYKDRFWLESITRKDKTNSSIDSNFEKAIPAEKLMKGSVF